jgi:hypothetical protein
MKKNTTLEVPNAVHREFGRIAESTGLKMKNVATVMLRLWNLSPKKVRDRAVLTACGSGVTAGEPASAAT